MHKRRAGENQEREEGTQKGTAERCCRQGAGKGGRKKADRRRAFSRLLSLSGAFEEKTKREKTQHTGPRVMAAAARLFVFVPSVWVKERDGTEKTARKRKESIWHSSWNLHKHLSLCAGA